MINPVALFIVMGTIVALVAIQRVLTRMDSQIATVPAADTQEEKPLSSASPSPSPTPPPSPSKPRGFSLMQGLTVVGLDDRGVDQFKSLIKKGDTNALAIYLASQRPVIRDEKIFPAGIE